MSRFGWMVPVCVGLFAGAGGCHDVPRRDAGGAGQAVVAAGAGSTGTGSTRGGAGAGRSGPAGSGASGSTSVGVAGAGGSRPSQAGAAGLIAAAQSGSAGPATNSSGRGAVGGDGSCDPGAADTQWATDCPTAAAQSCKQGTWQDPGSTTNDPVQCESAHFAVHAPAGTISASQCSQATDTLETIVWPTLFGSPIFFPEPYCDSATKYKASIVVHSDYGLTGGSWGDGYMGMWVGPGATADHWGLAHEFTHSVQAQSKGLRCDGPMSNNFCGWLFESHANWLAHQLPEYHTSNVHCSEMLVNAPHLYLGSTRDRYCNWQFMEYLKDKHCYQAVNDIWTAAQPSNDPFTNLAATRGWSTSALNDFFGDWARHNITWDYRDPPPSKTAGQDQGVLYRGKSGYGPISDVSKPERRLRTVRLEPLDPAQRRYVVPSLQAPQRFGYNVVRLYPDPGATAVTVKFRGVVQSEASSDWRWGLVATDTGLSTARYSALQRGQDGELSFCVQPNEALWLVVVATPSEPQQIVWDQLYPSVYRYPYMLQLSAAEPEGFQANAPGPSPQGMRWTNGGGWVASAAQVASGAYVGPYAAVLAGTVGANARIEDHAVVLGGNVESGTVGGLSVITSLSVSGTAKVISAWPYSPGFFEKPQSVSGSAVLWGDIEYRGANLNKTSGTYCGFVDSSVDDNCSDSDLTSAAPYAWRD